jgi:RND family efflux transporter MFP subunit
MNVQMPIGGGSAGGGLGGAPSSRMDAATITTERLVIRRRRRLTIFAVLGSLLVLAAAWYFMTGDSGATETKTTATKAGGPGAGGRGGQRPPVTVIVPGRTQVARTITATGTLAARRDQPVGVAGEGGLVSRVLVDAGSWVGEGQVLATIDRAVQTQQAAQIEAQIAAARADAALAQSELDRSQALVARGFVSKADIDRKTATRDSARARVRVAQAQLAETRARINRLDIRAPSAGLILDRNVEVGQVVSSGSGALFRLARGGEMEMLAQMAQGDLSAIRVGLPATVKPLGATQPINGSVWQVSPVIDPNTRQGEVRIGVPYQAGIRPGGFAQATIRAGGVDAPLLPQSAVSSDEKGNYVYVIGPGDTVVRRDVQIGSVDARGVAVVGGLTGQEAVVQSAGAFLNPGQKVLPRRAAAR